MWFAAPEMGARAGRRVFILMCCVLALASAVPREAKAGLIGQFANFTITNSTFANGYADSLDGATALFTGPNDGSGEYGTTDLTAVLPQGGVFRFEYIYSSMDEPGFDFAGYVLDSNFYWLADTSGQSGTVGVLVLAGQTVGFRIGSLDNQNEPGVLQITMPIPEPGGLWLVLIGIVLGIARRALCWRRILRLGRTIPVAATSAAALCGLLFCGVLPIAAQPPVEYTGINATGRLVLTGVTNLRQRAQMLGALRLNSTPQEPRPKMPPKRLHPPVSRSLSLLGPLAASAPRALTVTAALGIVGFNALSHQDQRLANHGNQFSIEPPSPSIAASGQYVLEGVNDAVQVYLPSGVPALPAPVSSNQVFGLAPAIDWATGVNGVYLTDMRVYYDKDISRWFILQRSQDNDVNGYPINMSHLYMAVSQTSDPTADYNIYVMDTTNSGHVGCPCIADYPQIGSDQHGFHIAWNEFNTYSLSFVDAVILTVSKASLAAGEAVPAGYQFTLPYVTGYEFAIQPATTPPGASNFIASGGIEYFVSTMARYSSSGGIALWAMRNTSSLATPTPGPILSRISISTLPYAFPDVATQRNGPLQYGWSLSPPGELAYLDGGDCRVQALTYAGGRLYLTFPTGITDETGRYGVGGMYVVLSPVFRSGVLGGTVLNQGYLTVNGNHVLRPAIAVNAKGQGAIAVTLVGPEWYPSAAFIPFDTFSTPSTLQVASAGTLPEDGFTGYPEFGGAGIARWGDYNSAAATSDGAIWMVTQYIGSYPRTEYANWNTYLARAQR